MTRTSLLSVLIAAVVVPVLAGPVLAVGHYEMVWFRMWDKSENAQIDTCIGHHVLQVWVFDENGNRMGNVAIRDQDGNCIPDENGWPTCYETGDPPESKQAEIPLWTNQDPFAAKCVGVAKEVASELGGGGSGKPEFAQGGGTYIENVSKALKKARLVISRMAGK